MASPPGLKRSYKGIMQLSRRCMEKWKWRARSLRRFRRLEKTASAFGSSINKSVAGDEGADRRPDHVPPAGVMLQGTLICGP